MPWEEVAFMPTKKKAAAKTVSGKKTFRTPPAAQTRKTPQRPEHSESYQAVLRDYAAALDLVHKREFATALEQFRAIEKASSEEPELAERARTYATFCARKLAPVPAQPVTAEDCYQLGVVRANEGRLEEAIQLFDTALHREPSSARVVYARAATRGLQGATAAAVADLRQAIAFEPRLRHQAANDPDFDKIRDEAAFIDVIEPTPAGA